jgi:hypothetical protein
MSNDASSFAVALQDTDKQFLANLSRYISTSDIHADFHRYLLGETPQESTIDRIAALLESRELRIPDEVSHEIMGALSELIIAYSVNETITSTRIVVYISYIYLRLSASSHVQEWPFTEIQALSLLVESGHKLEPDLLLCLCIAVVDCYRLVSLRTGVGRSFQFEQSSWLIAISSLFLTWLSRFTNRSDLVVADDVSEYRRNFGENSMPEPLFAPLKQLTFYARDLRLNKLPVSLVTLTEFLKSIRPV